MTTNARLLLASLGTLAATGNPYVSGRPLPPLGPAPGTAERRAKRKAQKKAKRRNRT